MRMPGRQRPGTRRRRAWAPLALAAVLLTGACGTGGAGSAEGAQGSGNAPGPLGARAAAAEKRLEANTLEVLDGEPPTPRLPATVKSADGGEVTVRDASRILPLTGGISEIVFTLGLGDRVIGRDISTTFAEAADLPVVTKAHDVSAENVLSLRPTVVLADTATGPEEAIEQIRGAGVPVVVLDTATKLEDVTARIGEVAAALGVPDAGKRLNDRVTEQIRAAQAAVPEGSAPRVAFLYLRGSAAVYLMGGPGSGADSLIEAAGAVDAGVDMGLKKDFTSLTSEALISAKPDVILMMTKGLTSVGGVDGLVKIPGIAETPAGVNRRVVTLEDGVLLGFGPRTPLVLDILVDRFHQPN
jgi:iron complex transport system substrate-binding protein